MGVCRGQVSKDKEVKPADQSGGHQPVVGEAGFREADSMAKSQLFAPLVEQHLVL